MSLKEELIEVSKCDRGRFFDTLLLTRGTEYQGLPVDKYKRYNPSSYLNQFNDKQKRRKSGIKWYKVVILIAVLAEGYLP